MSKPSDTFQYPNAIRALEKYAVQSYALPERSVFLGHCLSDIDEYMRLYFSEDIAYRIDYHNEQNLLPAPERNDQNGQMKFVYKKAGMVVKATPHSSLMQDAARQMLRDEGRLRPSSQYLLTQEEIAQSADYLEKNPDLKRAVSALQLCLFGYFRGLELKIEHMFPSSARKNGVSLSEFDRDLRIFSQEAGGFSFIHDLLPTMALSLSRGDGVISQHNLGKALCDAFRMQAFKSSEQEGRRISRDRVCPFGAHITSLLSRSLERQNDGGIRVLPDQKPGSLLFSLVDLVRTMPKPEQDLAVSHS